MDETPVLDIKPYIPQYDVPHKFNDQFYSSREAPDGEENTEPTTTTSGNCAANATVPNWVTNDTEFTVIFNQNAVQQLHDLDVDKVNFHIH